MLQVPCHQPGHDPMRPWWLRGPDVWLGTVTEAPLDTGQCRVQPARPAAGPGEVAPPLWLMPRLWAQSPGIHHPSQDRNYLPTEMKAQESKSRRDHTNAQALGSNFRRQNHNQQGADTLLLGWPGGSPMGSRFYRKVLPQRRTSVGRILPLTR